jgi:hypothetical protein
MVTVNFIRGGNRSTRKKIKFCDYINRIYPIELEINDITDTARSASYVDLHLEIDRESLLRTKFYDKRDDVIIPIVNFPFICNNLAAPTHGLYISVSERL